MTHQIKRLPDRPTNAAGEGQIMTTQLRRPGHPTNQARGLPAARTNVISVRLSLEQAMKVWRIADRNKISVSTLLAQIVDMLKEEV